MRDYGKVHTSFWSSQTIRAMSEDARSLALYLMTSPHTTIAGVFRLPDGYACEDLSWSCERVVKGFAELSEKGFADRCETTKWVWIRKHLDWNPPENPNQRKAALKCAEQIPDECAWKARFYGVSWNLLGLPEPPALNGRGTVGEPSLNQKQEQEQKQEQKIEEAAAATASAPAVSGGASCDGELFHAEPPSSHPAEQPAATRESKSNDATGSRLPKDWALPDTYAQEAKRVLLDLKRPDIDIANESSKFRDHFVGLPGAKGRKTDWLGTWRNWIRKACEFQRAPQAATSSRLATPPAGTVYGSI